MFWYVLAGGGAKYIDKSTAKAYNNMRNYRMFGIYGLGQLKKERWKNVGKLFA